MNTFKSLINALSVPVIIMNTFGVIVSGIWLFILREWWAFGGLVVLIISPYILAFLLLPSTPFSKLSIHFVENDKKALSYFFAFLCSLYVVSLITIWCVGFLHLYMTRANPSSIVPMLIWSYGMATGPWTYMAAKEGPERIGSSIGAIFASLGYIIMIIMVLFFRVTIIDLLTAMGITMAAALFFQFKIAIEIDRESCEQI